MRKIKLMKTVLAATLAVMTLAQQVSAANWVHNNTGWWWQEDNGSYPANKWKQINGKWYWFDGNGYMATGWRSIGGRWYWFEASGAMATGWRNINGTWYYMESSGAMATNRWIGNYYVEASGAMATNKWIGNYYVNGSGLWTQTRTSAKWIASGNRWWYRHSDGSYTRNGWETINGKDYLFDSDGWMVTGWRSVNGTWYYLENSGEKATNKWIGNYYVEANGAMATNKWIGNYYVNGFGLWVETKGHHNWDDGVITTNPTTTKEGLKTYTCKTCGDTYTEFLPTLEHNWGNFTWDKTKYGYACNVCYNDVTDYDDYYACHMGWHTHTFYQFASYYSCDNCDKLLHRHKWRYRKPDFQEGTDEIARKGYWECFECGNQSSDGKQADPILVSEEGHEYASIDHWTTPFNFVKDSHEWIVEDEYWEPADDSLHLQNIRIQGISSMAVGDTYQDTVVFTPSNPLEGTDVTWESSDPSVVSVDASGKVTALKNGTATITATSSECTDTSFIRVTENNVGHVKSATLCINGQSDTNGALRLKRGKYTMNVQTDPEQAVYSVQYQKEENNSEGLIANISGSNLLGNDSEYSWINGICYTDSSTQVDFLRTGTVLMKATIKDRNGDQIQLSQKVIIE